MRKRKIKSFLAWVLVAGMLAPSIPGKEVMVLAQDTTEVPEPYYEFTFDKEVADGKVENEGTKSDVIATIDGNGNNLGVVADETRGNNVLNLPGGGLNKGALLLPDTMFEDVTEDGFAFSFWINIDTNASQYSRIFSATNIGLNSDDGSSGWNAPEFTFVAGKEGADDLEEGKLGYNTSVMLPDRSSQLKLVWGNQFAKGEWQHVTVSVSPTEYDVYLDGKKITMTYDRNGNKSKILKKLFADDCSILKGFKKNAIGRSVYSTDNDLKAKIDEFRFYNVALTEQQAKVAYNSYDVSADVLDELEDAIEKAQSKSISFYTQESYELLQTAIKEGKEGLLNPVTETNVNRLIDNIEEAIQKLVYYDGITADTTFSSALLETEIAAAEEFVAKMAMSEDNKVAIENAIAEAKKAIESKKQESVDLALKTLRDVISQQKEEPTLHFNADPNEGKGSVFHGSTGFLYGVSEVNVPSADMIAAISPKILVQKAADGQQHPSGDGYRLTSYLKSCGVENIQIYLQDYYLQWPYESNGIEDYNEKVKQIVTKMVEGKTEEELESYSFVIFNEPNNIWYSGQTEQMCEDWLLIYNTIKGINPKLKVAGPNFSNFNATAYEEFFAYCEENDCLPEYITWHELSKGEIMYFSYHVQQVRSYVKKYYAKSDIDPILFVNETVNFDDVGNPGALINWLSIYDEEDVYASLPYWGLANSMNELAADANKPNGAWWVYKWYAQMAGEKAPVTLENIEDPGAYGRLYGMTSVDDENSTIHSLFGGQAGVQKISIENITKTKTFENADSAHVKIYKTKFTGHHGFADDIPVVFEGNLSFTGDDLVLVVSDAELMDGYYAVITPATDEEVVTMNSYEKNWEETYEAEDAKLIGSAKVYKKTSGSDLARSNRAEVGAINSEEDGVEFSVEVPQDGNYRLNVYYSVQAPQVDPLTLEYVSTKGQNRAIGALSSHTLTVDGKEKQELSYESTVKWGYYNYKTVSLKLTKGVHTIRLMHKGEDQNEKKTKSMLCALLDKIDLTYEADDIVATTIEAEELTGNQKDFVAENGKAVGSGAFEYYVNVPEDGLYQVSSKGNGTAALSKSKVNYAKDAKATSEVSLEWLKLCDMELGSSDAGMVYLMAGINRMCLTGEELTIDSVTFTKKEEATKGNSLTIEAEDFEVTGTGTEDDYTYLRGSAAKPVAKANKYASGAKVLEGFRGGTDNSASLTVEAEEAGDYKLSIFYANNEPAPVMKTKSGANYVHPYNTDLVERYMQITVNEEEPETVYFRNTFCWDTFKNVVVDVTLKKGINKITFTNDNSYKFSTVQDDFSPRLDKVVIAPAKTTEAVLEMKNLTVGNAEFIEEESDEPIVPSTPSEEETGKKENPISGVSEKIKKSIAKKKFVLKAQAEGTITYESSNKKVVTVNKTNGKVTIKGYGTATITIKASGNEQYESSTKKVTVTIVPRKSKILKIKNVNKKYIQVKWKKDKTATGYQIVYASGKKFKASKTVQIKKNKKTFIKIKKWKNKKMFVKVRAYTKKGKKKYYGAYSKVKVVKK